MDQLMSTNKLTINTHKPIGTHISEIRQTAAIVSSILEIIQIISGFLATVASTSGSIPSVVPPSFHWRSTVVPLSFHCRSVE
jgi:hypothetical protein